MRAEIPSSGEEDLERHAERKMALGAVRQAIIAAQREFGVGADCKRWVLQEVGFLPVYLYGNARELEEGMVYPRDCFLVEGSDGGYEGDEVVGSEGSDVEIVVEAASER